MPTIFVENEPYQVKDGQNLLDACLSLGFDLPYFCWHPALGSVGACRQCAIKMFKDENDTRGRIVMACMTPVTDGARLSIRDGEAAAFRASVIEWLMINHPHDCPVCDEGGECHLQDMTYMTGHDYRRYRFLKRTYHNQYLGPLVNHEMNRCIQCYRCVRFYRGYAGGHDLNVFGVHDRVYFGRAEDGVLESEFAGNLVEVCPTGVFTDKTLGRHYTRKWDLQTAPSICVHCSIGCNTTPGSRYGEVRRIRNRYNSQVNGYFLCDRGRYGYEFVNASVRVRQPILRALPGPDRSAPGDRATALNWLGQMLAGGARMVGIGSPRASLEANFALRTLVGKERFCTGMSQREARLAWKALGILQGGPARSPSMEDVRNADAVLVLGEDLTNVAPVEALALRQSVRWEPRQAADRLKIAPWDDQAVREVEQDSRGPLFLATVAATKLDEIATRSYYAAPQDIPRLGLAVAEAVRAEDERGQDREPGVGAGVEALGKALLGKRPLGDMVEDVRSMAETIAGALLGAQRPLVVAGTSLGSETILYAAAEVANALHEAGKQPLLSIVFPESNTLGVTLMGGLRLDQAMEAIRNGSADTVIVLENDLYRRGDAAEIEEFLGLAKHVIVLDQLETATTGHAEVLLPAATFAESDGTLVNNEGRAQRFYQAIPPGGDVQESWRWLRDIMEAAGRTDATGWPGLDAVLEAMVRSIPEFAPVAGIAPPGTFRRAGQKIARQPARFSGRTAMFADKSVHEPKPPDDPDSPLSFSMEGYQMAGYQRWIVPPLIPRVWSPGWNSEQALNKFQEEVGGPLRGPDPGGRLVEPGPGERSQPGPEAPPAFRRRVGEWLVVPLYHIFGSEELSAVQGGVAELAPQPYVGLNPADAAEIGVQEGQEMVLPLGGLERYLPVRLIASLPAGMAGVPSGLPKLVGLELPTWSSMHARGSS